MRIPISTPSHTFLEEVSGSGGGITWVGCRAITWVAAAAAPTGSSGVASTSWPFRTRSRSSLSSAALW